MCFSYLMSLPLYIRVFPLLTPFIGSRSLFAIFTFSLLLQVGDSSVPSPSPLPFPASFRVFLQFFFLPAIRSIFALATCYLPYAVPLYTTVTCYFSKVICVTPIFFSPITKLLIFNGFMFLQKSVSVLHNLFGLLLYLLREDDNIKNSRHYWVNHYYMFVLWIL